MPMRQDEYDLQKYHSAGSRDEHFYPRGKTNMVCRVSFRR